MSPLWSYALAAIGVTGLLIAAHRAKIGWWFNVVAQVAWLAYGLATRQWGFVVTAFAYAFAYGRLLRRSYVYSHEPRRVARPTPEGDTQT